MKLFKIAIILAVYLVASGIGAYMWLESYYTKGVNFAETKTIIVKKGESLSSISQRLAEEKVITHPLIFRQIAKFTKQVSPKFGEYEFKSGASPKSILYALQNGKTVIRKIVIPEGYSVYEIIEVLKQTPGLEGNLPDTLEEGSLMPNTYYYHWGDQFEDVIKQMQDQMRNTITELWPYRDNNLPFETSRDAIILASIVEKETGFGDEREMVASVFVNRLRKGMKLESDPTAVYGITKGAPLGRMPLRKDVQSQNPFNTYVISGLPPTPICNPGKKAIQAVLKPATSDYLFFVANGKGGHNFARTLDEHNQNVNFYRKAIANQ